MTVDRAAARRAIADFLLALGHDPASSPELAGTPDRVADAYIDELLAGHEVDIPALLAEGSPSSHDGLVVLQDVFVTCVCPHHMLPARGTATLAYVPGTRLFGLGTLVQLLDACSRRLVLQEHICNDVVDALMQHGAARGAFCALRLEHDCLSARGERRPEARVLTTARAGSLPEAEVAQLLRMKGDPECT
ncbi:MAG: GTP cyclohydrolase I [Polyangiaceae bacterium]